MPSLASERSASEVGECLPDFCRARIVVMGCGNVLLGDDGFGPAVISYLRQSGSIPDGVALLDAGTGITRLLFDIALSPSRPEKLVVVDAMKLGLPAGTVSCVQLDSSGARLTMVFAEHQEPTSCLLSELRDMSGIEVVLVVGEPEFMPEEVSPGLSSVVKDAVVKAGDLVLSALTASATERPH